MDTDPQPQTSRIARVVRRTRLAMALESALRAFWPLGAFAAAAWAAAAFGLADHTTRPQTIALVGAVAAVLLYLLVRGIRRFRWPSDAAARARIDARLPGRPLAALRDTPAVGAEDAGARSVWAAHTARMRRLAAGARAVPADLRLAPRDPWALRLMALVLLVSALVFARDSGIESVSAALAPENRPEVATGPSFEGWAEPPAYTGRPTLYLPEVPGDRPVAVPQGTRVTLRVYGPADRFSLSESVSEGASSTLAPAAEGIAASAFDVRTGGSITLRRGEAEVGAWSFVVDPDAPPSIEAAGPVERTATGEMRLAYTARDDYGVTAADATIELDLERVDRRHGLETDPEPRPTLEVQLPLPLSGGGGEIAETLIEDFSKHPWAGLPVRIVLAAEDAPGQVARSPEIREALPGRRFYDPLAAALVEQRRDLLWSVENGRRVTQVLRALTHRPEGVFDSQRAYLVVRMAIRRLDAAVDDGRTAAARDEVAEALWQAALLLEEGSLGDAAERLARAKERLQEALRNGASDEEIAQLMDELRDATRDYMEQMAREAIERGEMQRAEIPPGSQTMNQDQIQQLMDRIQELSEQGRKAEAEALLEQLQQMLENMQMMMTEGQPGQGQQGQGEQSLQGLADALREQQGLADESFQQLQREFRQGQQQGQGQQGGQPQPGQQGEGGEQSLAERQEALRELMEQLQGDLPGSAGEGTRESLDEAERNMGEARDGLQEGDTAGALDRQAEAIDNLREGLRNLSQDLQRAEGGQGQQGTEGGQATADRSNDPLGRPVGSRGSLGTNEQLVPEADAAARARSILDELRRRSGDLSRPQVELDYLRRLLDRF